MAELALPLTLHGIPIATEHYGKVWKPTKRQYKKLRGQVEEEDTDVRTREIMEDKGYVLRKRSEVQSDEEIVEVVRHRGERLPRRPGLPRRSTSLDDMRNKQMVPYRGGRRDGAAGGADYSDSEGSVPPRSRNGRGQDRGRAKSARRPSSSRSSSASSSDLGSSSGDEKKCRKLQRKKWITAGLAGVATIHAAAKVYSSIESHDKRIEDVKAGQMSPEDAHKKQRAARWQDAGAIAIAALGIKGAMSEWSETMEQQKEHRELLKHREEMHRKRLEHDRRQKARNSGGGYYKGRDGGWYYDHEIPQGSTNGRSKSRGPSRRSTAPVGDDY